MVATPGTTKRSLRTTATREGQSHRADSKRIVSTAQPAVKLEASGSTGTVRKRGRPGRPKARRQSHGSAWHWKQTDAWYYTLPGTKKRVPLFDEEGQRVTGKENKEKARLALARVKLTDKGELAPAPLTSGDW